MTRYFIITVILLYSISSLSAQDDFTFGACEPGKESCRECYLTLVKELFGNDGNVFNLSYVFTSPVRDEPSAVVVNYHFRFDNDTPAEVDTWFWAQSGAYILHPLFVFQFISLFFGNPKPIYEEVVNVTLNATECYGVQENLQHMTLLTQRLNVYMDEQGINPRILASYSAVAVNNETLDQVLNNITERTLMASRKNVLIACPIIATALTMFVTITALILYCSERINRNKQSDGLSDQAKAAIITISFISIGRILTFVGFDIGAIIVRDKHLDPQVRSIYHSGRIGELNDMMYNVPVTLLVFDGLALFACIIIIILAVSCRFKLRCYIIKDSYYYFLALTVIPLIFSAFSHAPYIIMAYVSDVHFASSIFIYYVIAMFVEFGVLEYTFSTLFKRSRRSYIKFCGLFLLAALLSIVINAIMATIFVFFFFVPIKYALSSAPNEVLVIYQSAIILVGGYITYKAVFKDKPTQFKFDCDQMNNDIAVLEDKLATESETEANPGTIEECRKKITTLKKEVALASLKQKLSLLQNENDNFTDSEITHLRNEICRLNKENIDYFKERFNALLSAEDMEDIDEKAYLNDKIYHAYLEIIEQLQRKIFYIWCNSMTCKDCLSYVVDIRKKMSTNLKKIHAHFTDHLDDIKCLKENIDDMDKGIKASLVTEPDLAETMERITTDENRIWNPNPDANLA